MLLESFIFVSQWSLQLSLSQDLASDWTNLPILSEYSNDTAD